MLVEIGLDTPIDSFMNYYHYITNHIYIYIYVLSMLIWMCICICSVDVESVDVFVLESHLVGVVLEESLITIENERVEGRESNEDKS